MTLVRRTELRALIASEVVYDAGASLPEHQHATARLLLVLDGRYEETCGGRTQICDAGALTFRPAGAPHSNRFLERTRCLTIEWRDPLHSAAPRWLEKARDHVRANMTGTTTARAIAATAGVHPSHLSTAFRRHFGCTLRAYARQQRVEFAATLLRTTREPLAAIAADAGFSDQSHFTRVFRAVIGVTPSVFRARTQTSF